MTLFGKGADVALRGVIYALATSAILVGSSRGQAAEEARPNILVIMVDDMGYSDPGCYGGEIDTPHIDGLASGGVRFTQFYNCSRCCQTRASLLTGAYPHRVGMGEFGRTMDTGVPTLAENLQAGGYSTGMVGKWHLSELPRAPVGPKRILWMNHELSLNQPFAQIDSYPTRRGFEKYYGIIWGVVDHFDPFSLTDGEEPVTDVPDDYYFTDAISERTVDYLKGYSKSDKPFFLYVAYSAPHWPIQARPEEIEKYAGRYSEGWDKLREERFEKQKQLGLFDKDAPLGDLSAGEGEWQNLSASRREYAAAKMAVHAAMVDRVDQGIGKIIEQLRSTGQLDNTVVMFLSDNGASPETPGPPGYDRNGGTRDGRMAMREWEVLREENRSKLGSEESYVGIGPAWASAVNTPLRYWKAESYDGGCRTPMIVHWPAGLRRQQGSLVSDVGHVVDIATTCYDLAGVTPQQGSLDDGLSLANVLAGKSLPDDRMLFFDHGHGAGVRQGKWKASRIGQQPWELFDLSVDPGETDNLATQHPEQLKQLITAWIRWREDVEQKPTDLALRHGS